MMTLDDPHLPRLSTVSDFVQICSFLSIFELMNLLSIETYQLDDAGYTTDSSRKAREDARWTMRLARGMAVETLDALDARFDLSMGREYAQTAPSVIEGATSVKDLFTTSLAWIAVKIQSAFLEVCKTHMEVKAPRSKDIRWTPFTNERTRDVFMLNLASVVRSTEVGVSDKFDKFSPLASEYAEMQLWRHSDVPVGRRENYPTGELCSKLPHSEGRSDDRAA